MGSNLNPSFTWPYEIRASEPDEFGVFVQQNGRNFGPTETQRIKGGMLTQVVRYPIRAIDLGAGIVIDSVDSDGTLHIHAIGGGGGGGSVVVEGTDTTMPSSSYHTVAKHSDNSHQIVTGPGTLTGINVGGAGSSSTQFPIYVKLFDTDGAPNLGSDLPIAVVEVQMGLQSPDPIPFGGVEFQNGLFIMIVNGIADTDDTAVATGDCTGDIYYRSGATTSPNSSFHMVTAGSTNHRSLKTTAGNLMAVSVAGAGSSSTQFPIYAKFYDKATTPVPGTDVPIWVVQIQMGIMSPDHLPDAGIPFESGLQMLVVAGLQDSDNTAVANGDAIVDVVWQ